MGWTRGLACAGAAAAVCACRSGFDRRVPGLAEDAVGAIMSDPGALVLEDGYYDVSAAVGGDGYAAAWIEYPAGGTTAQLVFAVASEDAVRRLGPLVLEIIPEHFAHVHVFGGTDGYLVTFERGGDTVFLALDAEGRIRSRRTDGSSFTRIGAVATPSGYTIAYSSASIVRTQLLDHDGGEIAAATVVESDPADQTGPAIGKSGDQLAVAWVDERTGSPRVRFTTLAPDGTAARASVQLPETGEAQGTPYVTPDGTDGFLLAYDGYNSFPQLVARIDAAGAMRWPGPAVVYDEARYHDTLDVAGAPDGRGGFVWITEDNTLLTNVQVAVVDGNVGAPPSTPTPLLVSDPQYSFCYPETARANASFGTVFAGEVEGSLALYLVIVPD